MLYQVGFITKILSTSPRYSKELLRMMPTAANYDYCDSLPSSNQSTYCDAVSMSRCLANSCSDSQKLQATATLLLMIFLL
jgi:hypothetical protein